MEVVITENEDAACKLAVDIFERTIRSKPAAVLGLATGRTMIPFYAELVRRYRERDLDLQKVTTFNLDEYVGLHRGHPSSYFDFMRQNLFAHVNIPTSQTFVPDGMANDILAECRTYEERIESAGGIDLQLLGIGADGHIGFNEPISSLSSRTRIKTLTKESATESRRWWPPEQDVSPHVLTMGIGTILESRCCLLLAFGSKKARAIAAAVEGPIAAIVPASALQMHRKAIVIVDEEAAQDLKLASYYRNVYVNKPIWQR